MWLQRHARKISVPRKILLSQMVLNPQPILRCLQEKHRIFIGFEFENCQPAASRKAA